VFNGEPLETTTKVLLTIINGNIVYKDLDWLEDWKCYY
jgi:hypothetical protein